MSFPFPSFSVNASVFVQDWEIFIYTSDVHDQMYPWQLL